MIEARRLLQTNNLFMPTSITNQQFRNVQMSFTLLQVKWTKLMLRETVHEEKAFWHFMLELKNNSTHGGRE